MNATEQRTAAKKFVEYWKDKGNEKQETARFWIELLGKVLGVEDPTSFIEFEKPVVVDKNQKYIDGYIPSTKILIEQKGAHVSLRRTATQSDGEDLTPYGQAFRYNNYLPYEEKAKWIIVSNFKEILIYNMNKPNGEPEQILLSDLPKEYYRLQFIVDTGDEHTKKEMEVSLQAGELVGKLYNAILKQYKNPDSPESLKSLNMLCVRLVFCLYAEDAGIFGKHGMFHDYLRRFEARDVRKALIELFRVLDQKIIERDPYLDEELAKFPYVNGGLFADENIEIPNFSDEIVNILLENASADFDWSLISPTIFGAVFESTLNPETRRSGGMHYTSIENIHKVIDPLFMNELNAEFAAIMEYKQTNVRNEKLAAFQNKLASLKFLDPACGSGNFLTETYISLRRLENKVIEAQRDNGQITFDTDIIKVSIGQFYGIEINDFAVNVAKTALWIAESQMMNETKEIVHFNLNFLPLKNYDQNIKEGNALRIDWESVIPKAKLDYIMGNPPFVGYALQNKEQKDDILSIYVDEKGNPYKTAGKIDYVAGWYFKAALLMQDTNIRTAFVSTNSITQGEQVAGVWKPLYDRFGIHIDYAHRTFKWDNRGENEKGEKKKTDSYMAAVHVVIVGFSVAENSTERRLFDNGAIKIVENINAYLVEAPDIFIDNRSKPICSVSEMAKGSIPVDDGNFFLDSDEYQEFIKKEPKSVNYIKKFYGAKEFLHNEERWCLWLLNISPSELKSMPNVMKRVQNIHDFRLQSTKAATRKYADYATRFMEIRQPTTEYIIVPSHSSENRRYIPIGFEKPDVICGNANLLIPNATLYEFGVLTSNVHMAWTRVVCGRIKSDYRYSNTVVYNNFPWCEPTPEQKAKIEQTAQAILDARAKYPDCSLADLYDELTMPPELRKAHHENDFAVMAAYGFDRKITESECVAELMGMYREMTEGEK